MFAALTYNGQRARDMFTVHSRDAIARHCNHFLAFVPFTAGHVQYLS